MSLIYDKLKLRWEVKESKWPYYKRVVGVGVDCDSDGEGYFLNSDGSKTYTNDVDAAMILLFCRTMAARTGKNRTYWFTLKDKIKIKLAEWLLL
jgi:hypothetical protein